jgi:hypothetical protein
MIIRNNINLFFTKAGLIAGILFIITGIWISVLYTIKGVLVILIGAFLGFSTETTLIDSVKKKIVHATMWVGLINLDGWIDIKTGMSLRIQKPEYSYLLSGKKRRRIEKGDDFYYMLLFDEKDEFILPIKKYKLKQDAENDLQRMKDLMGLS